MFHVYKSNKYRRVRKILFWTLQNVDVWQTIFKTMAMQTFFKGVTTLIVLTVSYLKSLTVRVRTMSLFLMSMTASAETFISNAETRRTSLVHYLY